MATNLDDSFNANELDSDQSIDIANLGDCINRCFQMSRDLRYSRQQRGNFYAHGVALRDELKILAGKVFETGMQDVVSANEEIAKVNEDTKKALQDIDSAAETVNNLGLLVHTLSEFMKIAGLVL